MSEPNRDWSAELHYMAGLCELAANGIGSGVDWEQVSKDLRAAAAEVERLTGALADEKMEHNELAELLSRPEIDDFQDGLVLEAAHQRQRWGDAHDRSKSAENWYWLVGYLAGKALRAAVEGNQNKARHHTISAAAALFQWHKAIGASPNGIGQDDDLKPVDAPIRSLEEILDANSIPSEVGAIESD